MSTLGVPRLEIFQGGLAKKMSLVAQAVAGVQGFGDFADLGSVRVVDLFF